jgi:DsbC/DsbD-like thiol-disulfide interchange protein
MTQHWLRSLAALATAAALTAGAAPAAAQILGRSTEDVVTVSFLDGWRLPNGNHMAALRIDLAPGWKTYWRAPGEGGVPTEMRLYEAGGVRGLAIHWPRPEVFFTNGIRSIGYRGNVILPIEFAIETEGPVEIEGRVEMGICLDVCMPIGVDVAGTLSPATAPVPAIAAALADRPLSASEAGAGAATCAVEPISDGLRVTVTVDVPRTGNDETVVVEHRDPMMWISDAVTERRGGTVTGTVEVVPPDHGPFALNRSDLTITVIGSRSAVEIGPCRG